MFCTQCGNELALNARFCAQCGRQWRYDGAPQGTQVLMRDMKNKKIAGVCAGLARYLGVDTALVRIVLLTLAIGMGVGFVAYIIAWIAMPRDNEMVFTPPPLAAGPPSA
jgi:phage shock protein C